jgi:hypothetical protein
MPLFDTLNNVQKYSPITGKGFKIHSGRVLDNKDPKMLDRIKVQIQDLLPFEDGKQLPWFYPWYPIGLGQGPLSTFKMIPEKDTKVLVVFGDESIYSGFYVGTTTDRLTRLTDYNSEYPERYGYSDSIGNKIIINKSPNIDTTERRYSDGSLTINDNKNGTFYFTDKYGNSFTFDRPNQFIKCKVSDIIITVNKGTLKVSCDKITLSTWKFITLTAKQMVSISSPVFQVLGDVFSGLVNRFYLPNVGTENNKRTSRKGVTKSP